THKSVTCKRHSAEPEPCTVLTNEPGGREPKEWSQGPDDDKQIGRGEPGKALELPHRGLAADLVADHRPGRRDHRRLAAGVGRAKYQEEASGKPGDHRDGRGDSSNCPDDERTLIGLGRRRNRVPAGGAGATGRLFASAAWLARRIRRRRDRLG